MPTIGCIQVRTTTTTTKATVKWDILGDCLIPIWPSYYRNLKYNDDWDSKIIGQYYKLLNRFEQKLILFKFWNLLPKK